MAYGGQSSFMRGHDSRAGSIGRQAAGRICYLVPIGSGVASDKIFRLCEKPSRNYTSGSGAINATKPSLNLWDTFVTLLLDFCRERRCRVP